MNVWADKKEDSEPLVINYISARGETDAALKTLKKLAEDYKKDHPDFGTFLFIRIEYFVPLSLSMRPLY